MTSSCPLNTRVRINPIFLHFVDSEKLIKRNKEGRRAFYGKSAVQDIFQGIDEVPF